MPVSRDQTPQQQAEPQIYVENGSAVAFYLYGAREPNSAWALSEGAREALTDKITRHGGRVCNRRADARVILVSHPQGLEALKHQYSTRRIHVEKPTFVDACIRDRRYAHKSSLQKGMGGRVAGRDRQPFTDDDERRLCEYIAERIPNEAAGGRTGTGVYEEVIQLALAVRFRSCSALFSQFACPCMLRGRQNPADQELAWALRHPAESWRERYKKNRARLDPRIDRIVAANPPRPDGKGLYHLSRLANKRRQHDEFMQQNAQQAQFEEEEQDAEEEENAGEFSAQLHDEEELEEPDSVRRRSVGPQRDQRGLQRDGRRSAPGRIPQRNIREPNPPGELEQSFDDLENAPFEPPSPQAGPSGTQRTPSPIPRSPSPPPAKKPPAPRPVGPAAANRPAADQVPMSSQATLVNPTQPRSPAPAHREQEDVIPPLKRQRTHARPIVLLDAPRGRSRNQPVVQQAKDEEPVDEPDEEAQSQPMGQTNEDALEVEVILGASLENNGRVSRGADSDVEVMDSEDERARKKLSLGRQRRSGAPAQSSHVTSAASRKRPLPEIEDMAAFAQGLDLGFGNASRRVSGSSGAGSSALTLLRQRAQGQERVTPSASRTLPRSPSVAESTSTSASGKGKDPVNRVPLDGTRASAQKKKARESAAHEEYVPEVGTRAAEIAVSGKRLRSRQLGTARR